MDNVKAKYLTSQGKYLPVTNDKEKFRSQEWFIENRGKWHG
jgi:hypothetical protein